MELGINVCFQTPKSDKFVIKSCLFHAKIRLTQPSQVSLKVTSKNRCNIPYGKIQLDSPSKNYRG